jgi:hypothetical protein
MERPEGIPEGLQQSQIGCIFGTSIISAACHYLRPNPSAGEATRGYLHGGLVLDFVGQLGPTPKAQLLLLDLALLLLQLLLVRAIASKRHWEDQSGSKPAPRDGATSREVTIEQQDAEEQGTTATDRPISVRDAFDVDRLQSGQESLGPFWILDRVTESHHSHHLPSNQPTSSLSRLLSRDIRRRQYSLNLPFGR